MTAYIFMAVFSILLGLNLGVGIKYKLFTDASSWHIAGGLLLLDLVRVTTVILGLVLTSKFYKHEYIIRLAHDIPSFLFDCVSVALLFMFMQTYQVLQDANKAVENMKAHKKNEFTAILVLIAVLLIDVICLTIDATS